MSHAPPPPPESDHLIALLWKSGHAAPSRGRPSRLSLEQIVEAAIDFADRKGLGSLSIRALAQELRSSPMALYNYVRSRGELLVLMLDRSYASMPRQVAATSSWRARAQAMARDHYNLILRHQWIADLPATRPALGPGQIGKYDYDLEPLVDLGLSAVEVDQTLSAILDLASASARQAVAARREQDESGMLDAEWWDAHAPYFEQAFDAERFPRAARIGSAAAEAQGGAYDAAATFEHGLALMLDGLSERLRLREIEPRDP